MEGLERSIPRSINYQDVLPVAVPAVARRRRFYPANGTTFNALGSNEIRIEIGSVNSLLDSQHSYLEMFVQNTNAAQSVGFDIGGTNILFSEVRVEQGGRVLAREQAHNRLHAGILSAAQVNTDGQDTESIGQQQRALNQLGGGVANKILPVPQGVTVTGANYSVSIHNDQLDLGPNNTTRLTMSMPTGLFTQDKLIPLPLVSQNNPITLVFVMARAADVGSWTGAPALGDISINRINYTAQMIEVGGDVIQQMKMMQEMGGGQLTISSTDFEHSSDVIPANSTGEIPIRIPARKRSIKSLFFQINSQDFANGAPGVDSSIFMNMSSAGNANMNEFQMKVGSVVYPPTPVRCWGNCARAAGALRPLANQERGECAMELAKAFGTLGFTNPTGRLSTINYGVSTQAAVVLAQPELTDGDNGNGVNSFTPTGNSEVSICPFGLDLESFQHTAIESGLDSETMAMETTLLCSIDAVTSGAEDKNVDCYILYDQHYYFNMDGSITFSN